MNTANWIPDLFMQRVSEGGDWTLFSPDDTTDLHDLYGEEFNKRYVEYEQMAARGELKLHKAVKAAGPVAQDAFHAVRNRPPLAHCSRIPATCVRRNSIPAWCIHPTCVPKLR